MPISDIFIAIVDARFVHLYYRSAVLNFSLCFWSMTKITTSSLHPTKSGCPSLHTYWKWSSNCSGFYEECERSNISFHHSCDATHIFVAILDILRARRRIDHSLFGGWNKRKNEDGKEGDQHCRMRKPRELLHILYEQCSHMILPLQHSNDLETTSNKKMVFASDWKITKKRLK